MRCDRARLSLWFAPMGLLDRLRRETSTIAQRERQDRVERLLTDGLRTLSQLLGMLADRVEKQRLERAGYEGTGTFLRRDEKR